MALQQDKLSQYDGLIRRLDGVKPYNGYLWPTESWWANQELAAYVDSRWHFGIVALADGRFAVEGTVSAIERNEYAGQPVVFATRTAAIRTAAARLLILARKSQRWPAGTGLHGQYLAAVINWIRQVVAHQTGGPAPKLITIKALPPVVRKTGLPLLDFLAQAE